MGCLENRGGLQSDLRVRTARGILWKNAANTMQAVIDLVATAALARLLVPEDFGIVTMAMIFVTLALAINEMGLGSALVQRKEPLPEHLNSVFWVAALMGGGLLILFTLSSPLLAAFFRTPALGGVLPILSLTFVADSLGIVHRTLLEREMRFRDIARCEVAASAGFGIFSVGLALAGAGVWSIVAGKVLQRVIGSGIYWIFCPWRPGVQFSYAHFRELLGFGANVMGENMAAYLYSNIDYFLVGRFLGSAALGLYSMAYRIVTLPLQKIAMGVKTTVYPAFSAIQDEPARMARAYLTTIKLLSLVVMPLLLGLMILAPELITGIFGEHWKPAVLPLQILVVAGLAKAVGSPSNSVFKACGKPDTGLKVTLIALGLTVAGVAAGIPFGISGVAVGMSMASVLAFVISHIALARLLAFPPREVARALFPSAWLNAFMVILLLVYRYVGGYYFSVSGLLLAGSSIFLGAGVYYIALRVGEAAVYSELKGLLRDTVLSKA